MTYVFSIEPRLTPLRPATPLSPAEALVEWCLDLGEELGARLEVMSAEELDWQPHPDSNSAGVTAWHVARWLDVLATRLLPRPPRETDLWHSGGWAQATGYEPDGIGFFGLGTLTGYTPEEMRAVPRLDAESLRDYLAESVDAIVDVVRGLGERVNTLRHEIGGSPFQVVGTTVQGSFGHVGEIDALLALRARWIAAPSGAGRGASAPHARDGWDDTPIACDLSAGEVSGRVDEWRSVLVHVDGREGLPDGGLRLTLDRAIHLDELVRLVEAEQRCCPFLALSITVDVRGIALEVRAPVAAADVVTTLFGAAT